MPCPDEDALNALASGLIAGSEAIALEAHVAACAECASALDDIGWSTGGDDTGDRASVVEVPLRAGERMGRYVVRAILGQGGMGTVYLADDPELGRQVALKVLSAGRTPSPAERARLSREARTMAKLADPGIVAVFDAGDEGDRFYIAMQLVEGETLASWLAAGPHPVNAILDVFIGAGRALAVAHAAGIVHRDFKPENVLLDRQGRALVTDFGVASGVGEGGTHVRVAEDHAHAETRTGHILGTPRYMAPEQHRRAGVTPASDQYSFCVSLYEALASRSPFEVERGPGMLDRLLEQKLRGPAPIGRAGGAIPARVRAAVERGLAPKPEDRFASMTELCAELEQALPKRHATWQRAALGAFALGLASLAAVGWLRRTPASDPCAHPEAQLAGVWDDATLPAMRRAFAATGRSYAEDTAARVGERLDAYTSAWTAMRREVCVASGAGKVRSESVALRDLCLDRRKSRLAALTRLFTEKPNGEAVDKAVTAVAELPPVADCLDVEALSRPVRRPEEPALRARVEELERRADAIDASFLAGRNAEAVALAEPLLAEVKTVPYAPLRAEVELELGQLRSALGEYAKAHAWLRDAAVSAAEGHADGLEAKAWARLLFLVSENEQRMDEAAVIYELGAGPVARAHDAVSEAAWLSSVGAYLGRKGSFEASKAAYRRVIDLREAALGLDHPQVGAAYHNMGALLNEEGEWAEAKLWYERALALKERTLGPDHPSVALSLNNLGVALAFTGDEAGALALYDRALRIWEETLGKEHPKLAIVLCNLGEARRRSGDAAGAVPFFERALSIREKALGASHPDMASPLDGLGRARTQLGELDVAEPLLRRALALREKATGSAKQEIAVPLLALGELEIARGSPAKAVPLLERALELHNPKTEAELHTALAEALWAARDRSSARAHMEAARDAFRRGGNARAAGKAEAWLAAHPTGRD